MSILYRGLNIIRKGFWGISYYDCNEEPPKPTRETLGVARVRSLGFGSGL